MRGTDFTGKVFGRLTVLSEHRTVRTSGGAAKVKWLCQCTCGNKVERYASEFGKKQHMSCGCWKRELASKRNLRDLTGQKFNRWTVLRRSEHDDANNVKWVCRCDCGTIAEVLAQNLTRNHSKSCGCYNVEQAIKNSTKHNMYHTRLHKIWSSMKARCSNPNEQSYINYGGRGIKVCSEWENFEPFMKWALGNGYKDTLTIDRIDVNGNYSPSNCKWSTIKEQARNK